MLCGCSICGWLVVLLSMLVCSRNFRLMMLLVFCFRFSCVVLLWFSLVCMWLCIFIILVYSMLWLCVWFSVCVCMVLKLVSRFVLSVMLCVCIRVWCFYVYVCLCWYLV